MVADKGLLVEHRPVAAEEAVLGRARHQPLVVLDRQADVEDMNKGKDIRGRGKQMNDKMLVNIIFSNLNMFFANLTAACNISIVAVVLALAGEGSRIVGASCG